MIEVLLPAALPSFAPIPSVTGAIKSRLVTSVHVPVVSDVAFKLYWKDNLSGLDSAPRRHCSPVYEILSLVIEVPELF